MPAPNIFLWIFLQSSKMRFAIIGSNFISDKFIEAGSLVEGFELAAVYSRTETRAQEFAVR